MDLTGTPKFSFRWRLMEVLLRCLGMKWVPRKEVVFGLGAQYAKAGALQSGSELDTFMHTCLPNMDRNEPFILPKQYISVEGWAQSIWRENRRLSGPTCHWGDFVQTLEAWCADPDKPAISLLNADFMGSMDKLLPEIKRMFAALARAKNLPEDSRGTLIAINVCVHSQRRLNQGAEEYPPALETLQSASWFRALEVGGKGRGRIKLVDSYDYDNKAVGLGSRLVRMHTLMFWWGLDRDISGIRGWDADAEVAKPKTAGERHCGKCGQAGHYQSTCDGRYPAPHVETDKPRKQYKCRVCRKLGPHPSRHLRDSPDCKLLVKFL